MGFLVRRLYRLFGRKITYLPETEPLWRALHRRDQVYEDGQIKTNLKDDKQLHKAIEILKDQDQYNSILSADFENKDQLGMKISMLDVPTIEKNEDNSEYYFFESMTN